MLAPLELDILIGVAIIAVAIALYFLIKVIAWIVGWVLKLVVAYVIMIVVVYLLKLNLTLSEWVWGFVAIFVVFLAFEIYDLFNK